ncbi:MAG: hypothetical protein P0Y60_10835 [Candidatus Microbacterium colombiense]|nr:MAG: hypothetical protein P0Y60_10835 [Microbacterium sp.]
MHPALLYLPGRQLSLTELSAARIDGHVVAVGDAFIPADVIEDADVRASSLRLLVQPGTAAAGPTAAWIHGAGSEPPGVHHIRRAITRRVRPAINGRLVFHDAVLDPRDVQHLGGIAVCAPVRTMLDLALGLHRDPRLGEWIDRLADVLPETVSASADILNSWSRVPGSRLARETLDRIALRRR